MLVNYWKNEDIILALSGGLLQKVSLFTSTSRSTVRELNLAFVCYISRCSCTYIVVTLLINAYFLQEGDEPPFRRRTALCFSVGYELLYKRPIDRLLL